MSSPSDNAPTAAASQDPILESTETVYALPTDVAETPKEGGNVPNHNNVDSTSTTQSNSQIMGVLRADDSPSLTAGAPALQETVRAEVTEAQIFLAVDALESTYNIPADVAKQAIAAVGSADVTKCYNYILNKATGMDGEDTDADASPIETCPHVQYHVRLSPDELPTSQMHSCGHTESVENALSQEPQDNTEVATQNEGASNTSKALCRARENNWLCLQCGAIRCSQYQHGVAHYKDSLESDPGEDKAGHCLAASLSNLSVWCDACEAYVKDPAIDGLVKKLEELDFGKEQLDEVDDNDDSKNLLDHDEESNEDSDDESSGDDDDDDRRHVGRGVPMLFGDEDQEEVVYSFGDAPKSLADVARFIRSDDCQSIIILAGAGMSVASGIPDFRSAGGLYDTLRPNLLTATEVEREAIRVDPTTALEMGMFLQNPLPCLELNRPFILGTRDRLWKATLAHRFVELLHMKTGKLTRLYQQNIDGLESQCTNLPRDKVVMVHGSMDEAECALCKTKSNFHGFCSLVEKKIKDIEEKDPTAPAISTPIACDLCGYETMKPSIVLFRSALPQEFFHNAREDLPDVDLLIVVGTSLAVAPANSLIYRSPRSAMRLVVNREPVGYRLGIDYSDHAKRDYFAQGDIDKVLLDLVDELGWLEDLQSLCEQLPQQSAAVLKARLERDESATKRQKVDDVDES